MKALVLGLALLVAGCGGASGEPEPNGEDRRAIDRIRGAGGDPARPHPVAFYLSFPSQEPAVAAAGDLRVDGYRTSLERAADGDSGWLVLATKTIVLVGWDLPRAQQELEALAQRHGGEYGGWDARARPEGSAG